MFIKSGNTQKKKILIMAEESKLGYHCNLLCELFLYLTMVVTLGFRRRTLLRFLLLAAVSLIIRLTFFPYRRTTVLKSNSHQIKGHNFIERATRPDKSLDVQRHPFLQARIGRDEKEDIFSNLVRTGIRDYWERFQRP